MLVAQGIATAGIAIAWLSGAKLRFGVLITIVGIFLAASLAIDLSAGWSGDQDPHQVYRAEGHALLHGHAPHAEYPPGAVVLFAVETAVGRGSPVVPNAVLMGLCLLLCVVAIARLPLPLAPWLAAVVCIAPAALYFVFFRFDAAPAAALLLGLFLAYRAQWRAAGLALGVGAALKWTPALALIPIVAWLVRRGERRAAVAVVASAIGAFALLNLPLFVLDPSSVLSSYRTQAGRAVTGESIWALPLAAVGRIDRSVPYWTAAGVPRWADTFAVGVQVGIVVAVSLWASRQTRPARGPCCGRADPGRVPAHEQDLQRAVRRADPGGDLFRRSARAPQPTCGSAGGCRARLCALGQRSRVSVPSGKLLRPDLAGLARPVRACRRRAPRRPPFDPGEG